MADSREGRPEEGREHPVLSGLLALVGVGLAVGLILGFVALGGSKVLGLDGESDTQGTTSQQSMYLPRPQQTTADSGPLITLAPVPGDSSEPAKPKKSKNSKKIELSAGQTSVGVMQSIDLSGTYPGGDGAILQVQRFTDGSWQDFYSVNTSVNGGTYATAVQTSTTGSVRFRMIDTQTRLKSNEVTVTVG